MLVDAWQGDPVRAILDAVAAEAGAADGEADAELPLDEALARYGRRLDGILLLVLDQFEEYFLYHGRDGDRLRHELLPALARADLRARVLISLREDTLASLDLLEGSSSPPFGNLVRLGPMPEAAAVEAITRPLAGGEMAIEPELPDHVLRCCMGASPAPAAGAASGPAAARASSRRTSSSSCDGCGSASGRAGRPSCASRRCAPWEACETSSASISARRWARSRPAERRRMAEGVPLPGHAVRREDRAAPIRPRPPHGRAGGRARRPAREAGRRRRADPAPGRRLAELRDLPRRPRAAAARLAGALPRGEAPAPRRRPRHGGGGRGGDRARCWPPTSSRRRGSTRPS